MDDETKLGLDALNRHFLLHHPVQAAEVIDSLTKADAIDLLADHDPAAVAAAWRHISPARIDEVVPALPDALLKQVLQILDPSLVALSLIRISEPSRDRCLELLPKRIATEVRRLMDYPPGSAGRVMNSRVLSFRGEQTAGAVVEQLRQNKARDFRKLFVVDAERRLTGTVDIEDLLIAEPLEPLRELARPPHATISPFDDREEVAQRLRDFHVEVLPVVDIHGRLIGAIRHDALLKTLEEAASADIQMMVGAGREERALSPPRLAVRKRLPWLHLNLATAFVAASVVGLFESTIAQFTALAVLMPVVAGESGNAGQQALAVTMRGLALREISTRHWFRVLFKEMNVGVMNGVAVAVTTAAGVYFWSGSAGLAAVIAIAMVLSIIAAVTAGSLIPITLTRVGQDPAQSSSIILTTVTDIIGFMSFLGIATLLAGWL